MSRNVKKYLTVLMVIMITGITRMAGAEIVQQTQFGMTMGDWSAAWWQYVLQIPAATNPAADTTGANCSVDQLTGPVFFLTGNFTSNASVTRNCTVPAGKTLIIPIINTECSTLEAAPFNGSNEKELRFCAALGMDGASVSSLQLIVDGKPMKNLQAYRVQSPVFNFHLPVGNILGLTNSTEDTGSSVSDGYWAAVPPLSPGAHTIHFGGAFESGPGAGFSVDVTYNLTVQ
uniref:Putative signal peptide protein n=1 Tax=Geobacter sp. (strain M21) TaxID=443144 RepID=C6DZD2_GEOSM